MPNEPERDIEKLLKACAQKRRDEAGAPLELHPATRRMLQGEVARRTVKTARGGNVFGRMLTKLRPRLAFGAAILAVLLVATWTLLPLSDKTKGKVQMAQRGAESPAKLVRRGGPEVPAAPAETRAAGHVAEAPALALDSARQESQNVTTTTQDGLEIAGVAKDETKVAFAAREPMPPARADDAAAFSGGRYGLARSPAAPASEPPSVTVPATEGETLLAQKTARQETRELGLVEGDSLRKTEVALAPPTAAAPQADLKKQISYSALSQTSPVSVTQKFAQINLRSKAALAAKAMTTVVSEEILTSFHVSQAGDQFQVIDSDGSTYAGRLQPAPSIGASAAPVMSGQRRDLPERGAPSAKAAKNGVAISAGQTAVPQSPGYSFQVSGINRTLNQRVVFTGNLLMDSNALSALQSNAGSNQRGAFQFQQNSPTPNELQNSRITGQAVLGGGRAIQINAGPVSP